MEVTKEQYSRYESVRKSGAFNMFSKEAQMLTGLDDETYVHILTHFVELHDKYEVDKKSA